YLWYNFYRLGLRPDTIYVPWMKFIVLTFVPVGLIASVPARLVLGMASSWMALWLVGVALFFLYISHRFWRSTLKHYTSASS
ncbi:MAG: ABC-2 family transporter protein, partial [Bdellovibrionota bacterium]